MEFEWDENKNVENILKHGISFYKAQNAFFDRKRVITADVKHSGTDENRFFCFGMVEDKILTVRFTLRNNRIRIFGAGYWREGRKKYEEKNEL
ncbi:MAG TPA: BrnT family toxin [Spirochaetota bacterium]|nr:BrnT family toxin [Spirochaetota bacterium]